MMMMALMILSPKFSLSIFFGETLFYFEAKNAIKLKVGREIWNNTTQFKVIQIEKQQIAMKSKWHQLHGSKD